MKLLLIAALAILATAHAEEQIEEDHEYILFPDGDGVPHVVDLKAKWEQSEEELTRNVNTVSFNLFTRNNPRNGQVLHLNNINSVTGSQFRANRATRVITHGWRSSQHSPACVVVRDAYLAVGDYNVIVVDWSNIASALYPAASGNVRNVAGRVAEFLNFMNRHAALNLGNTQIIGHSLGGHVAGIAALRTSGTIQGVVGLDPALPGFDWAGSDHGIHRNDAANVQVIHTNAGLLGLQRAAGDSDFYPNGGRHQPGCGNDVAGTCAHSRAYLFFAESILRGNVFRARENGGVFMGTRWLTGGRGSFTLNTRDRSPFGMG